MKNEKYSASLTDKEEEPDNVLHRKAGLYTYFSVKHFQTLKADIPLPPVTSDSVLQKTS